MATASAALAVLPAIVIANFFTDRATADDFASLVLAP